MYATSFQFKEISMTKLYQLTYTALLQACLLCLPGGLNQASAEALPSKPASVIIKNAMIANRDGKGQQTVSLVIKKGRLKMVTADNIKEKNETLIVDAGNGFLLGQLEVGSPANLMIMDKDPVENFDVLLDTQTHAVFVMRDGIILRNRLRPSPREDKQEKKEQEPKSGWFAYSAPPVVLPTSYRNTQKWNRFETKYASGILVGAVMLDRLGWLDQSTASEDQVGDLSEFNGGEIRALRLGMVGTFNFETPWIYTFFVATHAFDQGFDSDDDDKLTLFDLRLDIPLPHNLSLAVGKQKEPISMERLTPLTDIPMQERSAVSDSMMPSRNVGIVLSGTSFNERLSWAGGVFNPWMDQGNDISESPTQILWRGTLLPVVSADKSSLLHLGAGFRYSNAEKDIQYRSTPEINQAPRFVDTGLITADNTLLYDLEAAWRWGPFLLNGEYVTNNIDAPTVNDPAFTGSHLNASYVLNGEMRAYNRRGGIFRPVPVANPVTEGGSGSWEVAARFSNVDLQEEAVDGGEMDIYSLGLNWKLTALASVGINYRHVVLDRDGMTENSDGLMMRVTLVLE